MKSQTILILLILAVMIGAGLYYYAPLAITNTGSCGDYQNLPAPHTCTVDADCTHAFDADPNAHFRCVSQLCQVKFDACKGTVSP